MPELVAEVEQVAPVVAREHPSFGVQVGNVGEVRPQAQSRAGIIWIDFEGAEEPAEGKLLIVAHRLLGEDENSVMVEGRLDLGKDLGHYRPGEIDAAHFGAEGRVKRGYLDRHAAPHPGAVPAI